MIVPCKPVFFNLAVLLFCILFAQPAGARCCKNELQFWPTVYLQTHSHKRFIGNLEIQPRVGPQRSDFNSLLIRPWIDYELNRHVLVGAGYAWVPLFTENFGFVDEQRPWQQVAVEFTKGRFAFVNRFRLEERLFKKFGTSIRGRHRIIGVYALGETGRLALVAWNELFINLNDPGRGPKGGFDQDRFYFGITYKLNDRVRLSTGYQPVFVDRRQPFIDQNLHALRFDVNVLAF